MCQFESRTYIVSISIPSSLTDLEGLWIPQMHDIL